MRFSTVRVDNEQQFVDALRSETPDLILSDFTLPQFDGMSALRIAQELAPDIPFIFVSGTIGEERAIEALKLGATDYVLKTNLARLPAVVKRALQEADERRSNRRAEQLLRDIVETSQDWIWEIDAAGRYTFCSQGVREILGVEPTYLLGQDFLSGVHPADRPVLESAWQRLGPARRRLSALTMRWKHRDGSWRWLERNALALCADDGKLVGVRGTDRDVTLRKLQDERIARLNRIQMMLSSINSVVVRSRERQQLLQEASRIAVDTGGYAFASVYLVDTAKGGVHPFVWKGAGTENVSAGNGDGSKPLDQGDLEITERAIRTGESVVCNELDQRTAPDLDPTRRYSAVVALPLVIDATTIGTLNLYAQEAGAFTDEELNLLREVAGSISFALQYLHKEDAVQFLAYFDPLTSLARRSLFCERLERMLTSIEDPLQALIVVVLDIERLSVVNDRYGWHTGDRLLQLAAEQLKGLIKDKNCLAYLGAGTFGVVVGDVIDSEDSSHLIRERVVQLFDREFDIEGQGVRVSVRSGIARFPNDGRSSAVLLQNAEMALKSAKEAGEKYLHYVRDMNAELLQRLSLEQKLRQALEEGQYILHYQPKVAAETGRVVGVEALLRWNDPEEGLVSPGRFIPVLEESGLIVDVGKWVIEQALADGNRWHAAGAQPVPIAVNVSNLQLRRKDFADSVLRTLSSAGAWPIDIEITESALMEDLVGSARKLNRLKEAGVGIAIDDFGTGYSSLRQLSRLAVDSLKIDRSFIVGLSSDPGDMTIVSMIISLARAFDLTAVAEGVETHEQLKLLRLLKCHQLQGYLIAKPMPADDLVALLLSSGGTLSITDGAVVPAAEARKSAR
jgi:diguanylate cyclase (GGDEF)-like protein/PAS domain S-box-containing protein